MRVRDFRESNSKYKLMNTNAIFFRTRNYTIIYLSVNLHIARAFLFPFAILHMHTDGADFGRSCHARTDGTFA